MHPELFSIGPFHVYSYGLMIAIGMILAVWLGMRRCPARGLDKDQMFNLGFLGSWPVLWERSFYSIL